MSVGSFLFASHRVVYRVCACVWAVLRELDRDDAVMSLIPCVFIALLQYKDHPQELAAEVMSHTSLRRIRLWCDEPFNVTFYICALA